MDSVLKLSEIGTWGLSKVVAEIFFICIGIVFILVGLKALKDKQFANRNTTAFFWFVVAFTFIAGPYAPKFVTGIYCSFSTCTQCMDYSNGMEEARCK